MKQEVPPMLPIEINLPQSHGRELCVSPIGNPNGILGMAGPSRDMQIENVVVNSTVSEGSLHLSDFSNLTNWSSIPMELSTETAEALLPILREIEAEEAEQLRRAEEQRRAPQ